MGRGPEDFAVLVFGWEGDEAEHIYGAKLVMGKLAWTRNSGLCVEEDNVRV